MKGLDHYFNQQLAQYDERSQNYMDYDEALTMWLEKMPSSFIWAIQDKKGKEREYCMDDSAWIDEEDFELVKRYFGIHVWCEDFTEDDFYYGGCE